MDKDTSKNITASQIKKLVVEMKKINKKIDLRNPMISEDKESIVSSILDNSEVQKTGIRERQLDVDDINIKKNINHVNESEKDKWKRMMGYNVPDDESRNV
jgi:hypothetical protein